METGVRVRSQSDHLDDAVRRLRPTTLHVKKLPSSANTGWLADSGLPLEGVVDRRCRVTPHVVAAGDVTVTRLPRENQRRSPHWTSAVVQAQIAAATLPHGEEAVLPKPDPYYWTEQFGLDIKISGEIPDGPAPETLAGDPTQRSALLQWSQHGRPVAAAALNHRTPIVKLKKLGAWAPAGT